MTQRVFVDANVLYSKTQMDWLFLLRIHTENMFQVTCTEDVLAEVLRNLRKNHPRWSGSSIHNRCGLMRKVIDEVLPDFPGDLQFSGIDPDDYHVHAATVSAQADYLVTNNDPDHFSQQPENEQYEILHPDSFFTLVVNSSPPQILTTVIDQQRAHWANHSRNMQLDEALRNAGCPNFANLVRQRLKSMAR